MFRKWLCSDNAAPYNSYGNSSAMRVSPVGFAFSSLKEVLREAEKTAAVTHNHPEGIKGAQAIAAAIFMVKSGKDKKTIRGYIESTFRYRLSQTIDEIRHHYYFDETCPGSVPQAITAFIESEDYEDAIRKAVSLGGDGDTLVCMTGGIAQAYYTHIPNRIIRETRSRLDTSLLDIVDAFNKKYDITA